MRHVSKALMITIFELCTSEWVQFLATPPIKFFRAIIGLTECKTIHLRSPPLGKVSKQQIHL